MCYLFKCILFFIIFFLFYFFYVVDVVQILLVLTVLLIDIADLFCGILISSRSVPVLSIYDFFRLGS